MTIGVGKSGSGEELKQTGKKGKKAIPKAASP